MVQPQELQPPGDMTPADLEVPLELTVKPRIVTAVGRPGEDDLDILRQKGEFVVYLACIAQEVGYVALVLVLLTTLADVAGFV